MIMRQKGRQGHRFPTEDEIRWSDHMLSVQTIEIDEPIDGETFRVTPPDGVTEPHARGWAGGGSGGGFVDPRRGVEFSGSHNWEGETLVEHSTWKIRGLKLGFERRFEFTADGKELSIVERVNGPEDSVEATFTVPIDKNATPDSN